MKRFCIGMSVVLLAASIAAADPRPFTFVYDTYPIGKGGIEYEQYVTYRQHTDADSDFQRFDFRHEVEYGVADNFDLSIYFANWRYEDSAQRAGTKFDSFSVEGILYLSNPTTNFLGSGLYGEIAIGEHFLEFEQKLLLQKDVGPWIFAYNLVLETELNGVFRSNHGNSDTGGDVIPGAPDVGNENDNNKLDVEGTIEHDFGVSYALNPVLRVGAEATVALVYDNWSKYEGTTVYAGPNVSYQGGNIGRSNVGWWFTITPTFQLTDEKDQADFRVRMIAGIEF